MHPLARWSTALVVLSIAPAGRADPAAISVSIQCPAVDDEGRAALEARARADLLLERYRDGALSISCREDTARVVWSRAGGQVRTGARQLPRARQEIVDALLEEVDAVLSEDALQAESAGPPAPASSAATPPAPASSAAGLPAPASSAATPPAPALSAPATPMPTTPAASPALVSPGSAAKPDVVGDRDERPVEAASSRSPHPVQFAAGAHSELWSGAIGVAAGARVGLGVRLSGPWRLSLVGGPSWGMTSAQDLQAWELSTALTLDRDIGPHFDVGAGLVGSLLWASASQNAYSEGQLEGETAGALLRAAYRAPLGPIDLSIGPELEGLLRPVVVQVSGQEVFRLPTLVAGLDLRALTR